MKPAFCFTEAREKLQENSLLPAAGPAIYYCIAVLSPQKTHHHAAHCAAFQGSYSFATSLTFPSHLSFGATYQQLTPKLQFHYAKKSHRQDRIQYRRIAARKQTLKNASRPIYKRIVARATLQRGSSQIKL
jgi:hypothetical protein